MRKAAWRHAHTHTHTVTQTHTSRIQQLSLVFLARDGSNRSTEGSWGAAPREEERERKMGEGDGGVGEEGWERTREEAERRKNSGR